MADLARAAVGLLAWTSAVFGACAVSLALAGITRAAAVCCVVAVVAVAVMRTITTRQRSDGYASTRPNARRQAGGA